MQVGSVPLHSPLSVHTLTGTIFANPGLHWYVAMDDTMLPLDVTTMPLSGFRKVGHVMTATREREREWKIKEWQANLDR